MKQMLKRLLCLTALLSSGIAFGSAAATAPTTICSVTPFFFARSQSVDIADELAGWTQHVNLFGMDRFYGTMAIKPKYTQSFDSKAIARSLFGVNNCNSKCGTSLNISGSCVGTRGATDLLADYFYLPSNFQSTISFKPQIRNIMGDFNFYFGFDECVDGLFLRVHFPVVNVRYKLGFRETITNAGTEGYPAGYFACDAIPTTDLLTSFASYASGAAPAAFANSDEAGTAPITFTGLQYAKIENCHKSKTGVADLRVILGYNFVNCEDYHLGVGIIAAAPTGNRPRAVRLFEPIVGNGHHWELGAHITSHAMLWRSCDEDQTLGLYVDANITHMFKAKQRRTFDLCGKPLSRYMLATTFAPVTTEGTTTDLSGSTVPGTVAPGCVDQPVVSATSIFNNTYTPVANFSTQDVKVSVGVQGDVAAQLTYTHCNFAWDLGYNFWGTSCEKISRRCGPCPTKTSCSTKCGTPSTVVPFTANTFALKGDAMMFGFTTIGTVTTPVCIPLSATETSDCSADITGGSNFGFTSGGPCVGVTNPGFQNPNIDNAQFAYIGEAGGLSANCVNSTPAEAGTDVDQTRTSIQPLFLTTSSFAVKGSKGLSNKVYTNLSYQWLDNECWIPYIGIGGFAEFGAKSSCKTNCNTTGAFPACTATGTSTTGCNTSCNTNCGTKCVRSALSQWGVWAKLGVSFQ
jgi:hypothetical protein